MLTLFSVPVFLAIRMLLRTTGYNIGSVVFAKVCFKTGSGVVPNFALSGLDPLPGGSQSQFVLGQLERLFSR